MSTEPITFEGRLNDSEEVEVRRLAGWTTVEWIVLVAIVVFGLGSGVLVPSILDQPVQFMPLSLGAAFVALLASRQLHRRRQVSAVTARHVQGAWEGDSLRWQTDAGDERRVGLRDLRECRLGERSLLVTAPEGTAIALGASLFAEDVGWLRARAMAAECRRRTGGRRNAVLIGSLIGWACLMVAAWMSWEWWLR
jgi:hypothetical protein